MATTRPGFIWSGTEWVSIGQEAIANPISYQTSAPTSPATGQIWVDSDDDVPGIDTSQFLRWRKTAAGSETSLSGTDDTGLTLAYTAGYEQVYLNGVLLVRGQDYTATTGTSITGLTALAASDVVEVFGVVARVVGDVYTQAQADAKYSLQTTTGLVLITSATIGSAVSSVTVSNCFSSTYDNYKIVLNGGTPSASGGINLTLGSTTTGYYYFGIYGFYNSSTVTGVNSSNGASFLAGRSTTNGLNSIIEIASPNLATRTALAQTSLSLVTGNTVNMINGYLDNTTQYTGFTLTPDSGTLTGGTIKVYGYK